MTTILSNCSTGGCGAKMGPAELGELLDALSTPSDENLLVGYDGRDDAAVYRLHHDSAVVSTLDFFPPMVDDPYLFGCIAAANALSDVYAMGAKPIFALNLVCFPEKMDRSILGEILKGGADKLAEAGVSLAGGHSIYDREIKYGLSVTGLAEPGRILRNNGCLAGDRLILTKSIGTGIILAANRVGLADPEHYRVAVESMTRLNKFASETAAEFSPDACTDVTGFGLLVHAAEMAGESVSVELWPEALPGLPGAEEYAAEYLLTAAGQRNRGYMEDRADPTAFSALPGPVQELMLDPQTSGGLLFSVPEADADALLDALRAVEPASTMVGAVVPRGKWPVVFDW